jgi:3-ketosteroid 9alpha-monooxygenase subunit A
MENTAELPIPFGWYCVSLSRDLQPGEVKPIRYFDRELVMFRTEAGEAKVLDAYCPHLGAHLGHGGKVQGENIACPFHAWEFSGEGVCKNVPYAKNMPPKIAGGKPCIYAYPTVEKNQSVWVWYHPDNIAPLFDVEELHELHSDEWTDISTYEWTFHSHIQETAENGCDAAHFMYVHGSQDVPKGEVKHEGFQRHAHFVSKAPEIFEDGTFDTTGTLFRDSFLDTSSNGPGQTWQRFSGVFETFMMGAVTPIDAKTVHLRFVFTQPKEMNEGQAIMSQAVIQNVALQVQQDMPIWENKVYRPQPVLCDGDGPIAQFRKWFSQFYAEGKREELLAKTG